MAQIAFDASGVEPAAPLELLPPGKYVAQIVQSEMQPTKLGDGQMLCLELDILEGPHRGRGQLAAHREGAAARDTRSSGGT